ncbi:MAG: hypothetical protein A3A30_02820 [Candidatus Terrybacteria bacterium RIFCSPLOWO2_01_FULL_48_14]|nr:MAG: hypothetical protein A3A30_02820 [Candidatus Terrybacteria bacterium RIFCSPLOWO2_01_FULL_48_14]
MPVLTPQLSPQLLETAGDERTEKAIAWIAQRWKLKSADDFVAQGANFQEALRQSQVFVLSQTVGEVLAGKLHPNFVVKTLEERLNIPRDRARDIAHDVSREIFSRVRRELMDYYRITPEQKVAHPSRDADLRGQDADKHGQQEEPMKPSMAESIQGTGYRAQESEDGGQGIEIGEPGLAISNQKSEIGDRGMEVKEEAPAPPQESELKEIPQQPPFDATLGKPSLVEQVEEKSFPENIQQTGDRGQETGAQGTGAGGQGTVNGKPVAGHDKPEHFEPGPGQVIDLR